MDNTDVRSDDGHRFWLKLRSTQNNCTKFDHVILLYRDLHFVEAASEQACVGVKTTRRVGCEVYAVGLGRDVCRGKVIGRHRAAWCA